MAKRIQLSGTIEEQLKTVERYLNRMAFKYIKKVKVVVPPTVIFNPTMEPDPKTGLISNSFIAADGYISKVGIHVNSSPADNTKYSFICSLTRNNETISKSFEMSRNSDIFEINLDVRSGDLISFECGDPGMEYGKISTTILYHLGMSDQTIKKYLVDSIMDDVEGALNVSEAGA